MSARQIGPFILDKQIGVGGMGIVYSALYPKNNKTVAIKVLAPGLISDPKLLKRFEREIEILRRLDHPNIVKYYGGGIDGDQRWYAMEYIDGGSLLGVLKTRTRLSWEQTVHVGRQVSSALEHAHNAGIVHRDLKPANLFLSKKGRLKLGDFGIARDTEATALTAAGKTVGTYAYMAPEQIQAGFPITGKTDLYALGCLLYETVVGETPFQSDNPMDMLMQHLNDDPYNVCEKVPECPIWLDRLIERLLAKSPDDRPHDALAVHTELGEIRAKVTAGVGAAMADTVAGKPVSGKKSNEKDESPKKKKKKKKKKKANVPFHEQTWFLATCLTVLIGATAWLLRPPGEDAYHAAWQELMGVSESGQPEDVEYARREAAEKADEYLTTFPEGKYADEAGQISDAVHPLILETPLKRLAKRDAEIDSPFKAQCAQAVKLEDEEGLKYVINWSNPEEPVSDGTLAVNPLPAMQRWKTLITAGRAIKTPDDETRWLTILCENHHAHFRQMLIESPDAYQFLRERMETAEKFFASGKQMEAVKIWNYTASEFKGVQSHLFTWFYHYARNRSNEARYPIPTKEQVKEPPPAQAPAEDSSS
ncbi:MAG: serine/threonine-protein kinase [Fuerstiella sp.]|jgi:serine/threonine-protein kinase|nr:serine/threonine-protein kinase [Fuerstiella sp.]